VTSPVLIVNPQSSGGKTGKTFASMLPAIESALGKVLVQTTERPGHGIDLARAASEAGAPLVVAVGGDGTFHEIVNGVMGAARKARVGLIGQGTGGDFRKTLGLEHRLDKYLEALSSGRERPLDVGKVAYRAKDGSERSRFFVNIYSAGMGGLVDELVAQGSKALGGKAAYFVASTKALLRAARARVRCKITRDGLTEDKTLTSYMIAICNGRFFGGGMHVAPMAKIDDGKLEVVSLDAPSKLGFAVSSQKIYSGEHINDKMTTHFSCDAIELELLDAAANNVFLNDVDGEPLGGLPASVVIQKGALILRA
jgi:YegS/Rv2252/BmrU family lipid kinase